MARGDDPAHPSRPPHRLEQGRLAAGAGASPVREPAHRAFPKEAEDWDIERIVADYAAAAQRMQAAGLDGIEFEAYGHLMDQFWSPATNHRDDEYGGIARQPAALHLPRARRGARGGRRRFHRRHPHGRRRGLGQGPVARGGHRDRPAPGSLRGRSTSSTSSAATSTPTRRLRRVIPIQGMPAAPHLDFAGEVRAATKFPVFHAARIHDVATARHAIAAGKLDMVGMTRAHIADPHIVRKVMEGREHEIRPCVGATYCLDRIYEGDEALCIHNAATGREATMPHVIARSGGPRRKVVVVGAGPAGLEAARVAAERGHDVTVFEAAAQAGGQVLLAGRAAAPQGTDRHHRLAGAEPARRGVELHFNDLGRGATMCWPRVADVVIVATGGLPNTACWRPATISSRPRWDILSGDVKPAERVLLYDDNGAHPGMQAAEVLARGRRRGGNRLARTLLRAGDGRHQPCRLRRGVPSPRRPDHHQHARECRCGATAMSWSPASARIMAGAVERAVDQVVVEHGTLPLDDLYRALRPLSRQSRRGRL